MKRLAVALAVGVVIGSTATGLAGTTAGRYEVPRGYSASFAGMPHILCPNKRLSWELGHVPAGTAAVICLTSRSRKPDYYVVFEWKWLSVYDPSDSRVFRARMVTGR